MKQRLAMIALVLLATTAIANAQTNDPFAKMPADAAVFARSVAGAIDANDARAFLRMMPSRPRAKMRIALVAHAQPGGLTASLGLGEGAWHVIVAGLRHYLLYRGDGSGSYTYVSIARVKGAWRATGTGRFDLRV